jgi:hypothetical protein
LERASERASSVGEPLLNMPERSVSERENLLLRLPPPSEFFRSTSGPGDPLTGVRDSVGGGLGTSRERTAAAAAALAAGAVGCCGGNERIGGVVDVEMAAPDCLRDVLGLVPSVSTRFLGEPRVFSFFNEGLIGDLTGLPVDSAFSRGVGIPPLPPLFVSL